VSGAITLLGFWIAIWQIRKVKRAADAARDAALRMAQRVRSHELLAKLGDAHTHLEPIQKVVESEESVVIPSLAPVSLLRGAGCGSLNIAVLPTATVYATRAI
jgi:hypothetical protein